jgi:hypothetical protein
MKNFKTIILFMSVLVASCSKCDDEMPTTKQSDPNFFPLSLGSYWIYDWIKIDTLGNETPYNRRDSIYIANDTVINNNNYRVLKGKAFYPPLPLFYRDSSGFLVNERGALIFAPPQYAGSVLLSDTISSLAVIKYETLRNPIPVSVPAGDFGCANFQGTMTSLETNYPWGVRTMDNYYADSVGLVKSNIFFYSMPDCLERRLVEYSIQ